MTTFSALLDRRLRADPGQPLVTFYDEATGERTELSVKTYANWVNKTANLYVDELLLDPGDRIRLDLPAHWLGPVFLGAAWTCGLEVVDAGAADAAVVGPGSIDTESAATTLACSLTPFATRFAEPLPEGVLDHGLLWPGQSDVFTPLDASDVGAPGADDARLITDVNPVSARGRAVFLRLVAGAGSLVLVAHPSEEQWPARSQSERATGSLRDQPSS